MLKDNTNSATLTTDQRTILAFGNILSSSAHLDKHRSMYQALYLSFFETTAKAFSHIKVLNTIVYLAMNWLKVNAGSLFE